MENQLDDCYDDLDDMEDDEEELLEEIEEIVQGEAVELLHELIDVLEVEITSPLMISTLTVYRLATNGWALQST